MRSRTPGNMEFPHSGISAMAEAVRRHERTAIRFTMNQASHDGETLLPACRTRRIARAACGASLRRQHAAGPALRQGAGCIHHGRVAVRGRGSHRHGFASTHGARARVVRGDVPRLLSMAAFAHQRRQRFADADAGGAVHGVARASAVSGDDGPARVGRDAAPAGWRRRIGAGPVAQRRHAVVGFARGVARHRRMGADNTLSRALAERDPGQVVLGKAAMGTVATAVLAWLLGEPMPAWGCRCCAVRDRCEWLWVEPALLPSGPAGLRLRHARAPCSPSHRSSAQPFPSRWAIAAEPGDGRRRHPDDAGSTPMCTSDAPRALHVPDVHHQHIH
ncbi:hypothetical protein DdX_21130 [Ditylenchus destructor]|uniref:Uncharacterized protein n=1 Tax=Ditylenchus destructor TaxID=166010 RepID=A0AAD4MG30_9BILA|nr:hypothetical protein DdX_21130 [Ditylenchus destructor]